MNHSSDVTNLCSTLETFLFEMAAPIHHIENLKAIQTMKPIKIGCIPFNMGYNPTQKAAEQPYSFVWYPPTGKIINAS